MPGFLKGLSKYTQMWSTVVPDWLVVQSSLVWVWRGQDILLHIENAVAAHLQHRHPSHQHTPCLSPHLAGINPPSFQRIVISFLLTLDYTVLSCIVDPPAIPPGGYSNLQPLDIQSNSLTNKLYPHPYENLICLFGHIFKHKQWLQVWGICDCGSCRCFGYQDCLFWSPSASADMAVS